MKPGQVLVSEVKKQLTNQKAIALGLILLLSFIINLIGINWGLPSYNGWAADELIPSRLLEGVEQGFANGWYYKYPPVHFYLLTIVYAPILLLHRLNVVNVYDLPTYTLLFYLGRFLTVLMSVGLLFIIYLCSRELGNHKSALFTTLISSLNLNYIYYSKTINLDIPYLFWFMASLLFYLKLLKSHHLKYYLLFSLMAAVSVATKDQAYGFYLLTPFFIIWQHYRYLKQKNPEMSFRQSLSDRKITGSIAVGIGTFLLLHNVIFNLDGFFNHVNLIVGGSAKIHPRYEASVWGQLQMLRQTLTHLRFSMGWPFYAIALIGLFQYLPKLKQNYLCGGLLIPFISYYLFYIALLRDNDVRYLMPIALMLAFFGGQFLADWLNPLSRLFPLKVIAVTCLTIYTIAYGCTVNALMVQDSRYYAETWMQQHLSSDESEELILGVGDEKYLPRLDQFNAEVARDPTLEILATRKPSYIIMTSGQDVRRFAPDSPEYQFFTRVMNGTNGYDLIWEYESTPRWYLWNRQEVEYRQMNDRAIYSNFDKLNPRLKIFHRRG